MRIKSGDIPVNDNLLHHHSRKNDCEHISRSFSKHRFLLRSLRIQQSVYEGEARVVLTPEYFYQHHYFK